MKMIECTRAEIEQIAYDNELNIDYLKIFSMYIPFAVCTDESKVYFVNEQVDSKEMIKNFVYHGEKGYFSAKKGDVWIDATTDNCFTERYYLDSLKYIGF